MAILTAFGNILYSAGFRERAYSASFQGNILVPFGAESTLSGVAKTAGKDNILWYNRDVILPTKRKGKRILLHFGAVDWRTDIFVNGNKVGRHEGGYDPFTFDTTDVLKTGSKQQLTVCVWDPTTQENNKMPLEKLKNVNEKLYNVLPNEKQIKYVKNVSTRIGQ